MLVIFETGCCAEFLLFAFSLQTFISSALTDAR